jgi:hypothetical protein
VTPLAIDVLPLLGGLCVVLVVGLLVLVASPWRRHDAALDDDVQARLLLGDDPEDIARDLDAGAQGTASVADLRPSED